jgi:S-formylglutathione hydrolase FrmB
MQKACVGAVLLVCLGMFIGDAAALQGSLVTPVTFVGPVTGRTIQLSLYLPPGYAGGTVRYPVVYHFHGMGGDHDNQIDTVSQSHEDAVAAGRIGPVIIVFPDGDRDSFWADSVDGTRPIETNVVAEILPYVDAYYRTQAARDRRVVQGFSMGGFGAAKFASKFPHLFCAAVVYDGALVTWSNLQTFIPTVAASMFANDPAAFDQYSPWYWVTQNAAVLVSGVPFRQAVGSELHSNRNFQMHLLNHGISPEYVETGCPHRVECLFSSAGSDSWAFLSAAMDAATPTATPTAAPRARPRPRPRPTVTPRPTAMPRPRVSPRPRTT